MVYYESDWQKIKAKGLKPGPIAEAKVAKNNLVRPDVESLEKIRDDLQALGFYSVSWKWDKAYDDPAYKYGRYVFVGLHRDDDINKSLYGQKDRQELFSYDNTNCGVLWRLPAHGRKSRHHGTAMYRLSQITERIEKRSEVPSDLREDIAIEGGPDGNYVYCDNSVFYCDKMKVLAVEDVDKLVMLTDLRLAQSAKGRRENLLYEIKQQQDIIDKAQKQVDILTVELAVKSAEFEAREKLFEQTYGRGLASP